MHLKALYPRRQIVHSFQALALAQQDQAVASVVATGTLETFLF
jgi:hypothetical protein